MYRGETYHRYKVPEDGISPRCRPCTPHAWYRERLEDLKDTGHDPADLSQAMAVAMTEPERQIPVGVLYRKPGVAFQDRFAVLKEKALIDYPFAGDQINDILSGI